MNNIKNNVSNSVNGLWEEITMNENNINATQVNNEEETTMNNFEEWKNENKGEDFERKMEEMYKKVKKIHEKKKEYTDEKKSFEETVALAQQVGVEDEKILKNKVDIDNYFMPVGAGNFVNPEEEITVENEHLETEDGFDASSLIHRGNILIACPSSLYAYKEAIVLLRDVEGAIDTTDSYATRLSLESIKDGLMGLIAKYEADTDASGTTGKKKQLDKSILAEKVAGLKEVTAEKVSGLKEATSEKVSQAKVAINNIDEDNEYYQKGVEVTEKAKEKYNKVLGNVFNRLKL